ncbi:TrmH family RNA methyltransferase [Halovulum sp. GXIMD14793]
MENAPSKEQKTSVCKRADAIKHFRCKNLIAVIEDPVDIKNIGTVIRNVNALGVDKAYVVDPRKALPDDWQDMREKKSLSSTSVSAVKWTFVKRFNSSEECMDHLEKNGFISVVTSPHVKGKRTFIFTKVILLNIQNLLFGLEMKSEGLKRFGINLRQKIILKRSDKPIWCTRFDFM